MNISFDGKSNFSRLLLLCVVGILMAFAVSNQSYWIDEMTCKRIAASGSWSEFAASMSSEPGSDAQMPVFQAAMFVWDKVSGDTEWGFRLVNVFFWALGTIALMGVMGSRQLPVMGILLASASSAFLWYYLNEARPYAMQFAGASCLLAGYWKMVGTTDVSNENRGGEWAWMIAGTVLCAGSSLLGAPFAGLIFLSVLFFRWRQKLGLRRDESIWLAAWCVVLGLLACYYGWTLIEGKGASAANKTSFVSLGFSAFEQLGFMPYGPGRLALRSEGLPALVPWLPLLAAWAASVIVVLVVGGKQLFAGSLFRGLLVRALFPVVAMIGLLVVAGYLGGFRVLGRHFMPVYPLLLMVAGLAYVKLWQGNRAQRGLCVIIPMFALLGCLTQRYAERHHKDDYRGAVAYVNAVSKEGSPVWWAAATPSYDFRESVELHVTRNPREENLRELPTPTMVVLSKTDLYDSQGALRKWLAGHDYKISKELPAFKFYQRRVAE